MVFVLTLFQGRWKWRAWPPKMGIVPVALWHWILAVLVILTVSVMIWPIIGLHLAQYVGMGMAVTRHLTHWHRIFWPEICACTVSSRLMRILLLRFFKTITIILLTWFYGLFILLVRSLAKNLANAIFG